MEIRGVASRRRWLMPQHVAVHERMLLQLKMGAAQTMQQFANLLGEFNRVSGGQHQPAPATLVHQGEGPTSHGRSRRRLGRGAAKVSRPSTLAPGASRPQPRGAGCFCF